MNPFSIVLPIRGTEDEMDYMLKSLPSAFKLKPAEIIIGLDPRPDQQLIDRIEVLQRRFKFDNVRLMAVQRSHEWNFQLANVIWKAYRIAKHDRILSFDVDSVLHDTVLEGLDVVGKNNVAIVSYTKRLYIGSMAELIRHLAYRYRVRRSDYVFSGVYWIYRPYFFDTMDLAKYQQIYNGVDTLLCDEVLRQGKYRILTRKAIGVTCLSPQNEDLPWRQFQVGVWFAAHQVSWIAMIQESFARRKEQSLNSARGRISRYARSIRLKLVYERGVRPVILYPRLRVLIRSLVMMHPYMLNGYDWAQKHPDDSRVKLASTMDEHSWAFQGSRLFNDSQWRWEMQGTGFVEPSFVEPEPTKTGPTKTEPTKTEQAEPTLEYNNNSIPEKETAESHE